MIGKICRVADEEHAIGEKVDEEVFPDFQPLNLQEGLNDWMHQDLSGSCVLDIQKIFDNSNLKKAYLVSFLLAPLLVQMISSSTTQVTNFIPKKSLASKYSL
jgi:hypothetical protein